MICDLPFRCLNGDSLRRYDYSVKATMVHSMRMKHLPRSFHISNLNFIPIFTKWGCDVSDVAIDCGLPRLSLQLANRSKPDKSSNLLLPPWLDDLRETFSKFSCTRTSLTAPRLVKNTLLPQVPSDIDWLHSHVNRCSGFSCLVHLRGSSKSILLTVCGSSWGQSFLLRTLLPKPLRAFAAT